MLGRGECFRANVCCPSSSCKMYYVVLGIRQLARRRETDACGGSLWYGGRHNRRHRLTRVHVRRVTCVSKSIVLNERAFLKGGQAKIYAVQGLGRHRASKSTGTEKVRALHRTSSVQDASRGESCSPAHAACIAPGPILSRCRRQTAG